MCVCWLQIGMLTTRLWNATQCNRSGSGKHEDNKEDRKKKGEGGREGVCVCVVCSGVGCCCLYAYVEQNSSSKVP